MNLLDIDAVSYATFSGQQAASEMARLLWVDGDTPSQPIVNWYETAPDNPQAWISPEEAAKYIDEDSADGTPLVEYDLQALGGEVCRQGIDRGEWLWREAIERRISPQAPHWADMPPAQRMAWDTFVGVASHAYRLLRAHQLALEEAGRPAPGSVPVTIKREDSIFEEHDSLGDLRPEMVEALRNSPAYARAAEETRDQIRADQDAAEARSEAARKGAATKAANKAKKDGDAVQAQALSVGEAPVKPPMNKGGRGKKRAEPTT